MKRPPIDKKPHLGTHLKIEKRKMSLTINSMRGNTSLIRDIYRVHPIIRSFHEGEFRLVQIVIRMEAIAEYTCSLK